MFDGATVLYVEDNPENRMLIRRILQAEGYNVIEAENSTAALDTIRERIPDLVLMDINLPVVDGYALTNHIKSMPEMSEIPIIALTANVMKGDRERTLQAGCDGYIQKPVDVDSFPLEISYYLETRKSIHRNRTLIR